MHCLTEHPLSPASCALCYPGPKRAHRGQLSAAPGTGWGVAVRLSELWWHSVQPQGCREERQGLHGFGRAAPCMAQVLGVGAAMGSGPCPGHITVAVLAAGRGQATAQQLCPHALSFASQIQIFFFFFFHRKPSQRGCRGELWLVWAGARAAPLLSWGTITVNGSAGVLAIARPSPAAARHRRPARAARGASWTVPDPPRLPAVGREWLG